MFRPAASLMVVLVTAVLAATPALAGFNVLPAGLFGGGNPQQALSDGTVGDLMARIQRLEQQNRTLTGQVEEMQNQLRRNQDDFNRYKDDTDYRLQSVEGGPGGAPAGASAGKPKAVAPAQRRSQADVPSAPLSAQSDSDAGPSRANVASVPGRGTPPSTLGQLAAQASQPDYDPNQGVGDDGQQALDDQGGQTSQSISPPATVPAVPRSGLTAPGLPGIAVDTSRPLPGSVPASGPQTASLDPQQAGTPEDEYSADYRMIEARNYDGAEMAFKRFISTHPKDKRVPDATHFVGESLYARQQYRDAAEQFLKVTTAYPQSRRAPTSMLRLGQSLAALGEKDAACATFQEIGRKYPSAGTAVKGNVDRETKRNAC